MGKEYAATIITPFHNTDMSMFSRTYQSVIKQTIGFERIEWIIVLHNCKQEYIDAVRELVGKHENVYLKELVNEARSASSPRNYGLQFVTSPYIEFLDSDDTISENTVEKCVYEMEKHHAQIVLFRMAYLKENDSVKSVITDITLWNPLEEEIILTGDRLRCEELFSTINLCTHNRFFDADYLRSNHFRFDESITMAEDAYFTLNCYAKAEKIVVLPGFIGHEYYVNSSSAVQRADKTREELLYYAYGFKKMFDLLIDIHAYYNHFFITILFAYLQMIHSCPDFTIDDWKTLQSEMGPYAKMITPPPVNKFFTKEEGELTYQFIRKYFLTPPQKEDRSYANGEKTLAYCIRNNKDTAIGEYYDFETLSSIDGFRKRVPLYDHCSYDNLISLQTSIGESKLVTTKNIKAYAYDFNESSEMRTVPITEEICNLMGTKFVNEVTSEITFLMMESIPKGMLLNDGTYRDSAIGIMVRSGFESFTLADNGLKGAFTSPRSLIFPVEADDMTYVNLLLALRNRDVTQIYGSNTWVVSNYIEMILKQGESLIKAIETGKISIPHNINKHIFEVVSAINSPDPERAAELREAVREGKKERLLKLIWPKLKRVLARSGGNFNFYTKKIRKYLEDISLEFDDFITPFGIIAQKTEEENIFRLDTDTGFYEFLPADTKTSADQLLLTEIKPGKVYELVLTNDSGIYRMRTDIFIRIKKVAKDEVLFEECMKPVSLNDRLICDGNHFEDIVEECVAGSLYDYFYYYDKKENRFEILIESEQDKADTDYSDSMEQLLLRNAEYSAERESGLKPCRVRIIEKGTRLLWRDIRRTKYNAPEECFLPVHNIENIEQVPVLGFSIL